MGVTHSFSINIITNIIIVGVIKWDQGFYEEGCLQGLEVLQIWLFHVKENMANSDECVCVW